jgi:hypothetical protein
MAKADIIALALPFAFNTKGEAPSVTMSPRRVSKSETDAFWPGVGRNG